MSDTCVLVLTRADMIVDLPCDYIGVDQGSLILARAHKHMKLAIGDFDSIHAEDMACIEAYADEVIALNPIKDDSDSEAALNACMERGYEKMIVCGSLGGRIDHEIVNLRLAKKYPEKVILVNPQNRIYWLKEGARKIAKGEYAYISFFCDEDAEISLKGMKYPLSHRILRQDDLYALSNEIMEETAEVIVHKGKLLVIQSKDK